MTPTDRSVTAKVLALLEAFTASAPELTLSELSRRAGVSLPTTHRRAAELVDWGAWRRPRTAVTGSVCGCGRSVALAPRAHALREAALPFLEDLYVVTRQNVQLAVREGLELVFVERIAGRGAVPVLNPGRRPVPLHATGAGWSCWPTPRRTSSRRFWSTRSRGTPGGPSPSPPTCAGPSPRCGRRTTQSATEWSPPMRCPSRHPSWADPARSRRPSRWWSTPTTTLRCEPWSTPCARPPAASRGRSVGRSIRPVFH